jgi:hypothetical protein
MLILLNSDANSGDAYASATPHAVVVDTPVDLVLIDGACSAADDCSNCSAAPCAPGVAADDRAEGSAPQTATDGPARDTHRIAGGTVRARGAIRLGLSVSRQCERDSGRNQ